MLRVDALRQMVTLERMRLEFGGALGDPRRTRRARRCGVALAARPDASFPHVFSDKAEAEGFYRLMENDEIRWRALHAPHQDQTFVRANDLGTVLAIHDSTEVDYARYNADRTREHLVHLSNTHQGFHLHASLLAGFPDHRAIPLGVSHLQPFVYESELPEGDAATRSFWQEQGGLYENAAEQWFKAIEAVEARLKDNPAHLIHVMDREADSYPRLAWMQARNSHFVIRCSDAKRLSGAALFDADGTFSELPFQAEITVTLGERFDLRFGSKTSKHPPRKQRTVRLGIRGAKVKIRRARGRRDSGWSPVPWETLPRTLGVNLVEVVELEPPEGEAPVRWLLVTDEPIETGAQCLRVAQIYLGRWVIEEYFKCLKTGCRLEDRQIDSAEGLLRALALLVPCAWRLLLLRELAENEPTQSWRVLLEPLEFRVLRHAMPKAKLGEEATVAQVLWAIAGLGGHFKHNGRPGWQTL